ncbi:hypothetical protein JXA88_10730 [Candidatus Fermentibacteria bacterium]|nr:hypothetical protein [Candidatus Fermentibacteria bacterium]
MPDPADGEPVSTLSFLELRDELLQAYGHCGLAVPYQPCRYDPGDLLTYDLRGIHPRYNAQATLSVDRFVGGGFAGQVYRVCLTRLECLHEASIGEVPDLAVGSHYALKLLLPPRPSAARFRNLLYALGYQAHFAPQVNEAAVRTMAVWHKLIRRAAQTHFGDERAVCDTHATLFDRRIGAFGVLNEWVDGRMWKFEVDDRLFRRWKFKGDVPADHQCPEYVGKRLFMRRLVGLLHEMGAGELARQYEWWTCKSQPNALKRIDADDGPGGLTAIDFASGLVLMPLLPMSPADFKLIGRGLARGRLVQFDRGDLTRLRAFSARDPTALSGMKDAVEELAAIEPRYRASLPDVTHHRHHLLTDKALRASIREATILAWLHLRRIDETHAAALRRRAGLYAAMYAASWIPLLGSRIIRFWGHEPTRIHLKRCLTSTAYLGRAFRGDRAASLIGWVRGGRVSVSRAQRLLERPLHFALERMLLAWQPPLWHRSFTEPSWAWTALKAKFGRALRFLRDPAYREQQLLDEVTAGREEGMLTDTEAERVIAQIKDPYIQKYLRCLAVHVCTVPITQVVMIVVGVAVTLYCVLYRGLSWAESLGLGTAAAATIQLLPISPGSITRGVFVLYLMIKERDIKNYYIAAPISFIHVLGYLAFPFQMVTHNPALARFLAGRWTRRVVRVVPVFGEHGGLLEHCMFDLFFNVPLSFARLLKRQRKSPRAPRTPSASSASS